MRIPGLTYWQGGACGGALSGNGVSKAESTERNKTKEEKKKRDERGPMGAAVISPRKEKE